MSSRLPEVKNNRKIQITSDESDHGRLREVSSMTTCSCNHSLGRCVCSGIKIWMSGRLPEVKNNRKIQITSVESGRSRLREVLTTDNLTGKNLVFWKNGRLGEVVAYERWSHIEVRLYL